MKETISASQRLSLEQQVISNMKRIFLASLSENRHIFIRIPIKISIILACLVFKMISGGPPLSPNRTMNKGKPYKQSSPSSISVVLDCSGRSAWFLRFGRSCYFLVYRGHLVTFGLGFIKTARGKLWRGRIVKREQWSDM